MAKSLHKPAVASLDTGSTTSAMNRLVDRLSRLPGLGKRSAERIAFHLLKAPPDEARQLAEAIGQFKARICQCSTCFNLTEADPCPICGDAGRDRTMILVVEQPSDVATLETLGAYRGLYHVLMGRIAPLDNIGPGDLTIDALLGRIQSRQGGDAAVREVILGTNPTLEGDGTALYLAQQLQPLGVRISRLARGLAAGSSVETSSKAALADALHGRHGMSADP
jgi:recombination protein RecR